MKRRRILIVESDVVVRMTLEVCLTGLGPAAFISRRSARAARDISGERFDFGFIGTTDAGLDTFVLARALQARDIPFAFITNETGGELPRMWHSHARVTTPLRRASVQAVLLQAEDDLLVA